MKKRRIEGIGQVALQPKPVHKILIPFRPAWTQTLSAFFILCFCVAAFSTISTMQVALAQDPDWPDEIYFPQRAAEESTLALPNPPKAKKKKQGFFSRLFFGSVKEATDDSALKVDTGPKSRETLPSPYPLIRLTKFIQLVRPATNTSKVPVISPGLYLLVPEGGQLKAPKVLQLVKRNAIVLRFAVSPVKKASVNNSSENQLQTQQLAFQGQNNLSENTSSNLDLDKNPMNSPTDMQKENQTAGTAASSKKKIPDKPVTAKVLRSPTKAELRFLYNDGDAVYQSPPFAILTGVQPAY
ncbi:MAG: hypothetical protein AAGI66_01020 [Cyanobacteria bacterium P01_H01_bin.74]